MDSNAIEISLGWPQGCIQVFEDLFAHNIGRNELDQIALPKSQSISGIVKKYYKRGLLNFSNQKPQGFFKPRLIEITDLSKLQNILQQSQFTICDQNFFEIYKASLTLNPAIIFNSKEEFKSLEGVAQILSLWKQSNLDQNTRWLVVGGGLLSDLCAFAADLANIKFDIISTTLVGQVDASHGGKTGVNFKGYGKNLIGSFYFPDTIYLAFSALHTLPVSELYSGFGECIKHAILMNDLSKAFLLKQSYDSGKEAIFSTLMMDLIHFKYDVVSDDPQDLGRRNILNYGHSMAHAFESIAHENSFYLPHGLAVVLGIIWETSLALHFKLIGFEQYDQIMKIFEYYEFKQLRELTNFRSLITMNDFENRLSHYIQQDKKNMHQEKHISFSRFWETSDHSRPFNFYVGLDDLRNFCKIFKSNI